MTVIIQSSRWAPREESIVTSTATRAEKTKKQSKFLRRAAYTECRCVCALNMNVNEFCNVLARLILYPLLSAHVDINGRNRKSFNFFFFCVAANCEFIILRHVIFCWHFDKWFLIWLKRRFFLRSLQLLWRKNYEFHQAKLSTQDTKMLIRFVRSFTVLTVHTLSLFALLILSVSAVESYWKTILPCVSCVHSELNSSIQCRVHFFNIFFVCFVCEHTHIRTAK